LGDKRVQKQEKKKKKATFALKLGGQEERRNRGPCLASAGKNLAEKKN